MRIRIETPILLQTLQKVQNITEKKSNMPVLANILLKATDQQILEVSATDLELSLWTQIATEVERHGSMSIPARKLLEIVRELPQQQIILETVSNDRVALLAGRSRFEMATIPWEDFPHMNFYQEINFLQCAVPLLQAALSKTFYAIPMEDDPFSVAGIYWHLTETKTLRFVASDGHRLTYFETPGEHFNGLDLETGIVIPRKGVQEILRLIDKEKEVFLGTYENCLMLKTDSAMLSIQLLEAEFPEYQLIIPEERPFAFRIERESFHSSLKRMAVLTDQRWKHVRLNIKQGALELEAGSREIGIANDVLDIDYDGEDFTIAFNIRYVMDSVQAMDGKDMQFQWVDQFHGGVFVAPDDPGYFSLIMPMVV